MKKLFSLIVIGTLVVQMSVSAQENSQKELYARKAASFSKLKTGGVALTIGGIILTAVGIKVLADAVSMPYNTASEIDAADNKIILGSYATAGGLVATGGGIALWAIGGHKKRSYMKKFNAITLNLNPNLNQKLSLVYKF